MAVSVPVPAAALAGDSQALAGLRSRAAADPKAALREAARQFETLFMQEVMKSLRAATLAAGTLDNDGSRLGTEMLDQQLATKLAGMPGGLSEAIARQLERQMGMMPGPIPPAPPPDAPPLASPDATRPAAGIPTQAAAAFVEQHQSAAREAQAATGVSAAFMIGQAAHETGWGRRQIRHADGSPSHNLFGIKAGPDWKGPVAEARTTEWIGGREVTTVARFRAYAAPADSFADYARLIKGSPRYRQALAQGQDAAAFAQELQRAGYATDPAYADKLTRVINTTLRLQRASS